MKLIEQFKQTVKRKGLRAVLLNPENYKEFILDDLIWAAFAPFNSTEGVTIVEEQWDVLFILDACPVDLFEEHNDIKGTLNQVRSKGGDTGEFLERNFGGKYFQDIVYVTANPRVNTVLGDNFYRTIPVWRDEWDEQRGTVPADRMVQYCIDAIVDHPNKRVICHFLQPHLSTAYSPSDFKDKTTARMLLEGKLSTQLPKNSQWLLFREGEIDRESVWADQAERLRLGLDAIKQVLPHCQGEVIVTSDHGNSYGDRLNPYVPIKVYGHPPRVNHDSIRVVPWFRVEESQFSDW